MTKYKKSCAECQTELEMTDDCWYCPTCKAGCGELEFYERVTQWDRIKIQKEIDCYKGDLKHLRKEVDQKQDELDCLENEIAKRDYLIERNMPKQQDRY